MLVAPFAELNVPAAQAVVDAVVAQKFPAAHSFPEVLPDGQCIPEEHNAIVLGLSQ